MLRAHSLCNASIVTQDEIQDLLGYVSPATIARILALRPNAIDLRLAAMWLKHQGDAAGRPALSGMAGRICELASADEACRES